MYNWGLGNNILVLNRYWCFAVHNTCIDAVQYTCIEVSQYTDIAASQYEYTGASQYYTGVLALCNIHVLALLLLLCIRKDTADGFQHANALALINVSHECTKDRLGIR